MKSGESWKGGQIVRQCFLYFALIEELYTKVAISVDYFNNFYETFVSIHQEKGH